MGASAAAGHVVGCWLLHPMPSGRGGPFHSAAVGWEAVRGTAPVASTSGQDRAVRGERGREKRPVLWPTEMRGSFKYVQTDPPCHPSCCAREISLRYKDTLKSWARSLKGSQRKLKCVSPRASPLPHPGTLYSSCPVGCKFCMGSRLCMKFMLVATCRNGA